MQSRSVKSREETQIWEQLFSRSRTAAQSCAGLIIEGVKLHCDAHADAQNPDYVREEDEWAAWNTLEWHRKKFPHALPPEFEGKFDTWQSWLMYLLTPISKHYSVSKDQVLRGWTKDFMPTIMHEQTGEIWLPKP